MEIEDIQMFPKIGRIGEELIENPIIMKKANNSNNANTNNSIVGIGVGVGVGVGDNTSNGGNGLSRWHHHHSSRIIRVSRASGGKDRHSKVWTSKGLRDRRVRLSVSTALQFYDLQDRLGYDQPSKAVEWLIEHAAGAIAELPSLNTSSFPGKVEYDGKIDPNKLTQNPNPNPDATASCSSNSETSKNSGHSLSRSEIREKARVRARERTAKERVKEKVNDNNNHTASFTELLTGSGRLDPTRHWMDPPQPPPVHATMEYLSSGLILGSGQIQFPNQTVSTPFNLISDHQQQQQQNHHHHHHHHHHHQELSFVPDHLISQGGGGGGGGGSYSLDFNISSSSSGGAAAPAAASVGVGGFSRGTLQSNSPNHQSFFNNLQRFSSEGAAAPFFIGALPVENHSHHNHHFQLYYEDGCRNSEQKGKGKG